MSDLIADLRERLNKKTIHELRQIARAVGVVRPANGKKERLVEEITNIAACKTAPAPRSARGAPPKSSDYDKSIVADVERCMGYFGSRKGGTGIVVEDFCAAPGEVEEPCRGIFFSGEKHRFLRVRGCLPSMDDVYVSDSFINRFGLKDGDVVEGMCVRHGEGQAPGLVSVLKINEFNPDALQRREFSCLTPIYPYRRIKLGGEGRDSARMIDMFAPIGRGQRTVVETPPNFRHSTLLKEIAQGICLGERALKVCVLLLGERPEDVTEIRRSLPDIEVFEAPFGARTESMAEAAFLVADYLSNSAECGTDGLLMVCGISNLGTENALRLLSRAVCTEEGPSLTVIAFASEPAAAFAGVANCYIKISGALAALGLPAIDAEGSYSLNGANLLSENELACANALRRLGMGSGKDFFADIFGSMTDPQISEKFGNGR